MIIIIIIIIIIRREALEFLVPGILIMWEEIFYTPPRPGSDCRDCNCARIETQVSIHHPFQNF